MIPIIVWAADVPLFPTIASATACTPPAPVGAGILTVGTDVYPEPALVTWILWTESVTCSPVRYFTHIVSGFPVVALTAAVLITLATVPDWLPTIVLLSKF